MTQTGRIYLIGRLVRRDLRRHRIEAGLLLLAVAAAATTFTLGLAMNSISNSPYTHTRALTRGPDIVASGAGSGKDHATTTADLRALTALAQARAVTAHAGPYPYAWARLRLGNLTAGVMAEGRDARPSQLDQPHVTQGTWIRPDGVVLERSFADALGAHIGDELTLNRHPFRVAGFAVTAASPPYPDAQFSGNWSPFNDPGLVWLPRAAARLLATRTVPLSYRLLLRLANPRHADAFASAHQRTTPTSPAVTSSMQIEQDDERLAQSGKYALIFGSWLLGLIAAATLALVVGGRMAEQSRRVGLLKAVGATPRLVAAILLGEYALLALLASSAGLVVGWLLSPLLTRPGADLLGATATGPLTVSTAFEVLLLGVGGAALASFIPGLRAARTSTIAALAETARSATRHPRLISFSARCPAPILIGLRIAARRPRRTILAATSVFVTVTTLLVVVVSNNHNAHRFGRSSDTGFTNPTINRISTVVTVVTVVLVVLAVVNVVFVTWTSALDTRHAVAIARVLGTSPAEISIGLSLAQVLPAVPAALLAIPAAVALDGALSHGATVALPPAPILALIVLGTPLAIAALTTIPSRLITRQSIAQILRAERA